MAHRRQPNESFTFDLPSPKGINVKAKGNALERSISKEFCSANGAEQNKLPSY